MYWKGAVHKKGDTILPGKAEVTATSFALLSLSFRSFLFPAVCFKQTYQLPTATCTPVQIFIRPPIALLLFISHFAVVR